MARKKRLGSDPLSWIVDSRLVQKEEQDANNSENIPDENKIESRKADHEKNDGNVATNVFQDSTSITSETKQEPGAVADDGVPETKVEEENITKESGNFENTSDNDTYLENEVDNDEYLESENTMEISENDTSQNLTTNEDTKSETENVKLENDTTPPESVIPEKKTNIEPPQVNEEQPVNNESHESSIVHDAIIKDRGGKYLTFILENEEYGIEILKVQEIVGVLPITPVPHVENHVKGVLNLRGNIISVVDLGLKFDMHEIIETEETCIIVVLSGDLQIGVLVDKVSEVLAISSDNIEDAPSLGFGVNTEYINGIGKTGEKVTILLDIEKVLSTQDAAKISNFEE